MYNYEALLKPYNSPIFNTDKRDGSTAITKSCKSYIAPQPPHSLCWCPTAPQGSLLENFQTFQSKPRWFSGKFISSLRKGTHVHCFDWNSPIFWILVGNFLSVLNEKTFLRHKSYIRCRMYLCSWKTLILSMLSLLDLRTVIMGRGSMSLEFLQQNCR